MIKESQVYMIKEKLSEYNKLESEIDKIEKRFHNLESQSKIVSDVVQNGYKRHAIIRGYDYARTDKLDQLKQKLKERYDMALKLRIEIEDFIRNIDKSEIRQIFEYRYLDGMRWFEIARKMGYNNEDTPRKRHDRFLEKIA